MDRLIQVVAEKSCWHFWRRKRLYYWLVKKRKQKSFCVACDNAKIIPHTSESTFDEVCRSTGPFQ